MSYVGYFPILMCAILGRREWERIDVHKTEVWTYQTSEKMKMIQNICNTAGMLRYITQTYEALFCHCV